MPKPMTSDEQKFKDLVELCIMPVVAPTVDTNMMDNIGKIHAQGFAFNDLVV